jgi:hypothetical protein
VRSRSTRGSSRYIGVYWANSSSKVQLTDPQTKRTQHSGRYASEEDAARAYDCADVQAHGPGAKPNCPTGRGSQRAARDSGREAGFCWHCFAILRAIITAHKWRLQHQTRQLCSYIGGVNTFVCAHVFEWEVCNEGVGRDVLSALPAGGFGFAGGWITHTCNHTRRRHQLHGLSVSLFFPCHQAWPRRRACPHRRQAQALRRATPHRPAGCQHQACLPRSLGSSPSVPHPPARPPPARAVCCPRP